MALHLRKAGTRIDDEEMGLEEPQRASSDSSSSSNNSSRRWPRHGSASNAGKGLLREPPLLCVRIVWLLGLAFCCWMFTLPHWQLDDEPTPTTPVPASSSSTVLGTAAGQQQQQHLEQQQHLAMQHEREDSLRDTAQQHLAHKEAKAKAKAKAMAPRVRVPITHGLARGAPQPDIDGWFECDGVRHPATRLNDDYCDCKDGSDEPGTPACARGVFACAVGSQRLPSSFVRDGVCDCCDGSDELYLEGAAACPFVC